MEGKLLKTRTNRLLVNPVNGKYKMKPDKNYFRLKFVGEGTGEITIYKHDYLQYSVNGGPWESYTANHTYTVNKGDVIYFRAAYDQYGIYGYLNDQYTTFQDEKYFISDNNSIDYQVSGNIASLFWVDFEGKTSFPTSMVKIQPKQKGMRSMFYKCKHLVYAYDLQIPFQYTSDITHVCQSMFYGCTNLTHAPKELPSIVLPTQGYTSMFYGCSKLIHAPKEIPVISVPYEGFAMMFYECSSLVTAPHLKFNKLYNSSTSGSCCYQMFFGCSNLKNVQKELYPTTVYYRSYSSMFSGCSSLVTAPALPATTLAISCYESMFQGCTSLVTAPVLPATTLAERCYTSMFYRCSSLTSAPELPATTLAERCYQNMFNITSITTAPVLPALNLVVGCYNNMFYGASKNEKVNYIKAMFLTKPSTTYTNNWVVNVASTGTFVKNADATWENQYGTSYIPSGWTVVSAVA